MKRTIQINLSNRIFFIEEDAYLALDEYLKSIAEHFRKTDPEEEIRHDIEERLADLLEEKTRLGHNVITADIVGEVIGRIGHTEQIFEEDEDFDSTQESEAADTKKTADKVYRKFYRDPNNKILFGVLAGIAAYFHFDANILRILYLILLFTPINIPLLICYLAFAIFTKPAVTVTERLEMTGEEVSPDSIWRKIEEETGAIKNNVQQSSQKFNERYKILNLGHESLYTTNETGKPNRKEWVFRGLIAFSLLAIICLIGVFAWNYYSNNSFGYNYNTYLPFIPWSSQFGSGLGLTSLILLIIIPVILIIALVLALGFFIILYPIGLIIRANTTPIIKGVLIVLWFVLLYYLIS